VYMARALSALGAGAASRPLLVVEPGLDAALRHRGGRPGGERDVVHGILVANLVAGKGVLPFLEALAPHLRAGAPVALTVIGSLAMDSVYAAACQERVAREPALAAAVRFVGPLPHAEVLARLDASDLLVSPSRMESFGLALAEARALGVPIVARAGGNAAA